MELNSVLFPACCVVKTTWISTSVLYHAFSKLYILTEVSANDVKIISVDRQKLDLSEYIYLWYRKFYICRDTAWFYEHKKWLSYQRFDKEKPCNLLLVYLYIAANTLQKLPLNFTKFNENSMEAKHQQNVYNKATIVVISSKLSLWSTHVQDLVQNITKWLTIIHYFRFQAFTLSNINLAHFHH